MENLTEKQWKQIIKKEGCAFNPLYKTRGEYANLPMYMRVYISLLAKKEVFDEIENKCSIWDTDDVRGSPETKSGDKWLSMNIIKKLKERHLLKKEWK